MRISLPKAARFFLLLAFVLAFAYSLSNFIGLSRGGFESQEILQLQTFYLIGIAFAVILISLFLYSYFTVRGDKIYGESVGFSSLGETPHVKFFSRFTQPQIFLLFLIIFSVIALGNIYLVQQGVGQKSYTGVGYLQTQQFTATDSIIYSTSLIPAPENLGAAVLIALALVFLGIFVRKRKMSVGNFFILCLILIPLLTMLFGIGNHLLRYRGSEIAITTVAIFWYVGGLLTVLTGSFIPFWVMHMTNNFFFDLSRFFSNETIVIYTVLALLGLIIGYAIIYRNRIFGEKKIKNVIEE